MTPRELAAAIRRGHTMIGEKVDYMPLPSQEKSGCALCAAWFGAGYTENDYWGHYPITMPASEKFAIKLQIPIELAQEINDRHCTSFNRLAIADWLDTLEPETKPADK